MLSDTSRRYRKKLDDLFLCFIKSDLHNFADDDHTNTATCK